MAKQPEVDIETIEFDFQVRQVKSMADHSINLTINLPEYAAQQAAELMQRIDEAGRCALVFVKK